MKFTHPDSEFNPAIEKAIHKNFITRGEYHKIVTLSCKDLELDAHEKRLLDHIQFHGNRSVKSPARITISSAI